MNKIYALETDELTRRFGDIVAVNGLTLTVERGEVFGILGHNGAGKTTTVRLLNGVLAPSSGSARVLGCDPALDGAALRQRTGVLTETPALNEKLTARENLRIYADLYGVPRAHVDTRATELLRKFDLAERADEPVGGYSKGMKQRLALARTLLHDPELLFLDEPTAGLDPIAARKVHTLIAGLIQDGQHTIVLCTHNLTEAQKLCHRVSVLEHGSIVALGTPRELARDLRSGLRLEIELETASAQAALDAARAQPDVQDVQWHPERGEEQTGFATLRINAQGGIPTLVDILVDAGGRIYRLSPQEPTLEDVYFALHE